MPAAAIRKRLPWAALVAGLLFSTSACDLLEDPEPQTISLSVRGAAGAPVEMILSTVFVAGVTETGVTQVRVFLSDTVTAALPWDTVIAVDDEQRFFVQAAPTAADTLRAAVRIDVNSRNLFDDEGVLLRSNPFRFVYQFNVPFTRNIEVLF